MFYLFSKGGKLITKLLYLYAKNKKYEFIFMSLSF